MKPIPWKRAYANYARQRREHRKAWRKTYGLPPDEHDLMPEPALPTEYDDEDGD